MGNEPSLSVNRVNCPLQPDADGCFSPSQCQGLSPEPREDAAESLATSASDWNQGKNLFLLPVQMKPTAKHPGRFEPHDLPGPQISLSNRRSM